MHAPMHRCTVLPFGVANGPSYFQEFQLDVFGGWQLFRPKGGEVFLKEFQGGPGETVADSLVKTGVQQHEMQSDLIPSHWTTSVPLFECTAPLLFASFGVQEIIEKMIENEAQSSSKPPPGASGGTLGPIGAPSEKMVEK